MLILAILPALIFQLENFQEYFNNIEGYCILNEVLETISAQKDISIQAVGSLSLSELKVALKEAEFYNLFFNDYTNFFTHRLKSLDLHSLSKQEVCSYFRPHFKIKNFPCLLFNTIYQSKW